MDAQVRGTIKSTSVQLITPKDGDPYIEGKVVITFAVDDSRDVAKLTDIQAAGLIVATIASVQLSMRGIRDSAQPGGEQQLPS
jgi:hypothetical protein